MFITSCHVYHSHNQLIKIFKSQKYSICRSFHECSLLITLIIVSNAVNISIMFSMIYRLKVSCFFPFHLNKVHSCARVLITKREKKEKIILHVGCQNMKL